MSKFWEGYKQKYPTFTGPSFDPGPIFRRGGAFKIPPTPKHSQEELEEMSDPTGHKLKRQRPKDKPKDKVNHPAHYGGEDNPYETIKVLEAKLTYDEFIGFCKGSAIKYLDRANHKDFPSIDYNKSEWYLTRMNDFIKRKDAE